MKVPKAILVLAILPVVCGAGRVAPPAAVTCPRDDLTVFIGRVHDWKRGDGRVGFKVRTDEETTQEFNLRFAEHENPFASFLLNAEPYRPNAWSPVETTAGRLREGMRAIVWVCDDGSRPLVDFRPPEMPGSAEKKEERR